MTWEPLPDRRSPLRPVDSVLERLHHTLGLARPDTVRLLERHWESLVGSALARRCSLSSVRHSTLVVTTDDPAVAQQLRWAGRDLVAAANAVVGAEVLDEVEVRVRPDSVDRA